ncbi:MAG TPA: hypothetical protein VIQ99_02575 [Gammaproteobacteria bacterium]
MSPSRTAYGFVLVCLSASACEVPTLAVIPETIGDDVADVLVDVRRYSDETIVYTDCLKAELAAAGGDAAPASVRSVLVARNNHAVAEHKATTDLYAERVGPLANLSLAEYVAGESRDCLQGSVIEHTGVVNDGAVIFFLGNRQAYLNVLQAACPGLERDGEFFVGNSAPTGTPTSPSGMRAVIPGPPGPFTGAPLSRRVCTQDHIFPYKEGGSRRVVGCNLGRFFPMSEDQALQILTALGGAGTATSERAASDAE